METTITTELFNPIAEVEIMKNTHLERLNADKFEQIFHSTVIIQSLTKNQLRERIHNAKLKDIRYSGKHKGFYSLAPKGVKVVI